MAQSADLIDDRDPLFTAEFLSTLAEVGTKSVKLLPRSPNPNSYAERRVRSIKEACLDRMILFREEALRTAVREFIARYYCERNHRGHRKRPDHARSQSGQSRWADPMSKPPRRIAQLLRQGA